MGGGGRGTTGAGAGSRPDRADDCLHPVQAGDPGGRRRRACARRGRRDLRRRYAARFRILPTSDSLAALSTLEELALAEDPVALIVADQRMPALSGTDLLTQVADSAP